MIIQENTIIHGDSLTVLRQMEPESVDAIITDPPYGINYVSQTGASIKNDKSPFIWFLYDAFRVLKSGESGHGGLICFTRWDVEQTFIDAMKIAGFNVKSEVIWDKVYHGMGDTKAAFAPSHENIVFAVKGKYSFPGSDEALQGQDFPFPTVLVQDNVFGRARLHYGWWPSSGLYWSKGLLTLDMITDYDAAGGESAVTLDLRFEGTDPGTELPTLSYTKDGIVTAELQPDGTGHYKVRIVGQAIGSTEIIATLGDYTARLAVDVTAKLSISVDQLSVEQYVGESTTLTLTARDGTGQVLTGVKWDVVSGSDRVVTLSPVSRDQQVTVTGKGEGEETLLVQAGVTVGQRTFTSELRLTATIHMQGVLGIAHVGDGDAVYHQGILNRDATDWDTPLGPAEGDVPDHEGLYLYSRGKAADFRYFTVTALTVLDSTGTSHDMLSNADEDYRVTVGDVVAAQQDGDFSYRPITIHGRQQETVTLQVTLTDTRTGRPYTLDIPYTLTAEDHLSGYPDK